MSNFQKWTLIFLSVALLFPLVVSLSHVYSHELQVNTESDFHFHKTTLNCEICQFHYTSFTDFQLNNFNFRQALPAGKNYFSQYEFLSGYQQLAFELRGPPGIYGLA